MLSPVRRVDEADCGYELLLAADPTDSGHLTPEWASYSSVLGAGISCTDGDAELNGPENIVGMD
jgi:hypothetical protein